MELKNGKLRIPADPKRLELGDIKNRQKARKETGTPKNASNEQIYQMLLDVLENQARQENTLRELFKRA